MMKPIIFNTEMVQSILRGEKTQTRRLIKPQPDLVIGNTAMEDRFEGYEDHGTGIPVSITNLYEIAAPYQPGDILYVRETFVIESNFNLDSDDVYPPPFNDGRPIHWADDTIYGKYWQQCHYKASDKTPELAYDDCVDPHRRWRPPASMPKWAARLYVVNTSTKAEQIEGKWYWVHEWERTDKPEEQPKCSTC